MKKAAMILAGLAVVAIVAGCESHRHHHHSRPYVAVPPPIPVRHPQMAVPPPVVGRPQVVVPKGGAIPPPVRAY